MKGGQVDEITTAYSNLENRVFSCRECELCVTRIFAVPGRGWHRKTTGKPTIVFVGEAPGANEDAQGIPFVGRAGDLLRSTLSLAGFANNDYWLTNTVKCRPPGNRNPTQTEIEKCRPHLEREFAFTEPEIIVAVGEVARKALAQMALPPKARLYHIYHPAYILRAPAQNAKWIKSIRDIYEDWQALEPGRPTVAVPSPSQITRCSVSAFGDVTKNAKFIAYDSETDKLEDGPGNALVSMSAASANYAVFSEDPQDARLIQMNGGSAISVFHNAKYDAPLLFPGRSLHHTTWWDDTMLMAYCLGYERVGLKALGAAVLSREMTPITEILRRPKIGKKGQLLKTFEWRPFSEALRDDRAKAEAYAIDDAVTTALLYPLFSEELGHRSSNLQAYYHTIEKPTTAILLDMELAGIRIDPDQLVLTRASLAGEIEARQTFLNCLGGFAVNDLPEDFDWQSNRQVARILQAIGVPLTNFTETGQVRVDKAALLEAAGYSNEDELHAEGSSETGRTAAVVVSNLLKLRQARKIESTYIEPLLLGRDSQGRIHARFNQTVANTNRLSSSEPNLQNIPARGIVGKALRQAFVAAPGHLLVKADYSQLEVRIWAHYSQEPVLIAAYPWGAPAQDVHQMVADTLGIKRSAAKNVLFATIYGAAAPKLAETAGIPFSEAEGFLLNMRQKMPALANWQTDIARKLRDNNGLATTMLGWERYLPEIHSLIPKQRSEAIRQAANFPIQGTAAGIVKLLMIAGHHLNWADRFNARLLLQVHDEVVYEVPDSAAFTFAKELKELGETIMGPGLSVPLELNVSTGHNWADQVQLGDE